MDMMHGQIQMCLFPVGGGTFTRIRLDAVVGTVTVAADLNVILSQLATWSGWPVELVLHVVAGTPSWCDCWSSALSDTSADDVQLRLAVSRAPSGGTEL